MAAGTLDPKAVELSQKDIDQAIQKSAAVILSFQQPSGAYPASPYFRDYNYCWFRDGSFIADGMSRIGQITSAERFFTWGSNIITDRRDRILNGNRLDARYTYDGYESTEPWQTFQIDGYGTFLWAMKQHSMRHDRSIEQYQEAAGLIQHYLATHWRESCFDWWEEQNGQHAATLACIYAGLKAYEHPEAASVKTSINLSVERTDASLLACTLLDAVESEAFIPVVERIERELVSKHGGVYRYREDTYYGGGEWPVLTSMLGWYYLRAGRLLEAKEKIAWDLACMQPNGWLPEQVPSSLLHPDNYQTWVERSGNPANPLLWSQAMLLTLGSELKKAIV